MPLREYYCRKCEGKFEAYEAPSDTGPAPCPSCKSKKTEKLFSAFQVAGRGDLRESSNFHGCHSSHSLAQEPAHVHSASCAHSKGKKSKSKT